MTFLKFGRSTDDAITDFSSSSAPLRSCLKFSINRKNGLVSWVVRSETFRFFVVVVNGIVLVKETFKLMVITSRRDELSFSPLDDHSQDSSNKA